MSRPETHDDLASYDSEPVRVFTMGNREYLDSLPGATAALGALLDQLRLSGAKIVDDTVLVPRSAEDLDRKLKGAQANWDGKLRMYHKWADEGEIPQYNMDKTIQKFAEQENLMDPAEVWAQTQERNAEPLIDDRES